MRRLLASTLGLSLALPAALCALVGCNETDPEALYIDVLYQLRCIDCEPRTNDGIARDIHHLDGDQGFDLGCESTTVDGDRRVSFSAEYFDLDNESDNYSIQVDQAGLDGAGNGPNCSIKVLDSGSTYEGLCADDEPTEERPCVVDLKKEGDIIRGTLFCDRIPIMDMTSPIRYLKRPNSNKPAELEIRGCTF